MLLALLVGAHSKILGMMDIQRNWEDKEQQPWNKELLNRCASAPHGSVVPHPGESIEQSISSVPAPIHPSDSPSHHTPWAPHVW